MAPATTTTTRTRKAAPVANGASKTKTASKKRKAEDAEADAETKPVAAKRTKGQGFDVKELDDAIQNIDSAKKTKKVAPTKTNAPKPSAKHAEATIAFDIEPKTTLTNFKTSPPDASSLPVINEAPSEVLTVFVFGTGDMSGDLGLGPKKKTAKMPTVIPELDGRKEGTYRVVMLACGGMHTVALTADSKIVTWGGNDDGALGRDSAWEGGLRDMDAEQNGDDDASDDSDDEGLNPVESTPTHIPESSFPPGTRFTHVAAGDSCSFAVTDTGLVYGWGTFAVSWILYRNPSCLTSIDLEHPSGLRSPQNVPRLQGRDHREARKADAHPRTQEYQRSCLRLQPCSCSRSFRPCMVLGRQ